MTSRLPVRIDIVRPTGTAATIQTSGGPSVDWSALETEWRKLEADSEASFFQSWTWVGCRVESRFTDPLLLCATEAGRVVGLALFNRRGPWFARTLNLLETGCPAEDSVFIEHSGPLLARGHEHLLKPMLEVALRHGRLALSGVDDAVLQAAQSLTCQTSARCHVVATRLAPFADLTGLDGEQGWLSSLSASTRYRLRRSYRSYEGKHNQRRKLVVRVADCVPEALKFLDALALLHQRRWTARGKPGAFANPAFVAFHRSLVARGLPRGEVEQSQISAVGQDESQVLGYLYNIRWRGKIYSYQSGFDYNNIDLHQLPGLTCHQIAINTALSSGIRLYDFMAGDSQYKRSLSNASKAMHWLELTRSGTYYNLLRRVCGVLSRD